MNIFIFRRDFRLNDNLGLNQLYNKYPEISILPIFIFDSFQIDNNNHNKSYRSENAIQFMCESLEELDRNLHKKYNSKLHYFYGNPSQIIEKIIKKINILAVGFNADFSEYSLKRDNNIVEVCKKNNIDIQINYDDLTLIPISECTKEDGNMYLVFSAFYKMALNYDIQMPKNLNKNIKFVKKFKSKNINFSDFYSFNSKIEIKGGREFAKKILNNLHKNQSQYNTNRDLLSHKTTQLSGYLKFGCVSIRECYWMFINKLGKKNDLIKQLYWRTFYFAILKFVRNSYDLFIDSRFNKIKWINGNKEEERWEKMWTGNTGFLVIDAAVRELITSGFMHNRGRLLVGNFATKIFRLHPFLGKYASQRAFARYLIDGEASQNMGNWSWVCGDKLDPSGMRFGKGISGRIFDPTNFKKWDPECKYIKKWLPNLRDIPNNELFNWQKFAYKYSQLHPSPFIDFKKEKEKWKKIAGNIK